MKLLNGKKVSEILKNEIHASVLEMTKRGDTPPHLAVILVGDHPASTTYVNSKVKACKSVGFESTLIKFPTNCSEEAIFEKINQLNQDPAIDGFMVQLPLPAHINEQKILTAINPSKDVDGFHPENFGRMALDLPCFIPATPYGILELLKRYQIETTGKHVVVIGRSYIVGKPMSILLGRRNDQGNSTVTTVHRYTKDIASFTKQADIVIAAMGVPKFVTGEMLKEDAIVIDVGITRVETTNSEEYEIVGDVDFKSVKDKCSYITPVPGGVGPMTIAMLLKNTLMAKQQKITKFSTALA